MTSTTLTCRINNQIRLSVIIDEQNTAAPDDLRRVAKVLLAAARAVETARGYLDQLGMEAQVQEPEKQKR